MGRGRREECKGWKVIRGKGGEGGDGEGRGGEKRGGDPHFKYLLWPMFKVGSFFKRRSVEQHGFNSCVALRALR